MRYIHYIKSLFCNCYLYLSQSRSRNISGNFSGDGLQNGGVLIVTKGGDRVLLNHREETPGDHVANNVILEKLGITQVAPTRLESSVYMYILCSPYTLSLSLSLSLPPSLPPSPSHKPMDQPQECDERMFPC